MTPYELAQRYVGQVFERAGDQEHPLIQWWLSLCGYGFDAKDEVAWCSAFLNGITWELRLPRSKSAAARSWLSVGIPITALSDARVGYDVVVLNRGGAQDATKAGPGHVGLFAGVEGSSVVLLAGNQSNGVSVSHYPISQILGIRRLSTP